MKQILSFALIFPFLLTACSSTTTAPPLVSAVTPVSLASTLVETATSLPSETPILPLEKQPVTQESVAQFASAMQKSGINITAEQILQQGFQIQIITGLDGKQHDVAITHLDPDPNQKGEAFEGDYPLIIKTNDEWEKVGLKDVARIPVGAHIQSNRLNDKTQKIIIENFNGVLFNWDVQWKAIEPTEGQVDFSQEWVHADKIKQFTDTNNISVIGQSVFWPALYPDWLKNKHLSKEETESIMQRRISTLSDYFGDTIGTWIVVNEYAPISFINGGAPDDILLKTMGEGYIDLAFQMARKTFPQGTILISNHNLNETRNSVFYAVTKKMSDGLKSKNLIDGIGIQMHIDGNQPPPKDELIATMNSYELPVYITELDVNMKDVKGTQEERLKKQADIYKNIIEACLESETCESIYFFDIGDSNSWYEEPSATWMASPNADSTLFDDGLNPKICYYSVLNALLENTK